MAKYFKKQKNTNILKIFHILGDMFILLKIIINSCKKQTNRSGYKLFNYLQVCWQKVKQCKVMINSSHNENTLYYTNSITMHFHNHNHNNNYNNPYHGVCLWLTQIHILNVNSGLSSMTWLPRDNSHHWYVLYWTINLLAT